VPVAAHKVMFSIGELFGEAVIYVSHGERIFASPCTVARQEGEHVFMIDADGKCRASGKIYQIMT
jgi:hypothetical protein